MKENSIDVMLDLETTGVSAGCCILSIGACTFDRQKSFYEKISHYSCYRVGLVDTPSTMSWWSKQSLEAREEAFSGTINIVDALGKFSDFIQCLHNGYNNVYIWGNGADFDLPILGTVFEKVGMEKPWEPYNGRCYRTLKNLFPEITARKFIGVKHNALADAQHQAGHALEILRYRKELLQKTHKVYQD